MSSTAELAVSKKMGEGFRDKVEVPVAKVEVAPPVVEVALPAAESIVEKVVEATKKFICGKCGFATDYKIALLGHSTSHLGE